MKNIHINGTPLRRSFIQYLTLNRKAERTIHSYTSYIYDLAKFHHRPPDQLTGEDLQAWLYDMIAERKLAPSTVNIAFNALRAFYGGLLERDVESILCKIQRPKRPARVPRPYSMGEMEKLLTVGTEGDLRAQAFLTTVYGGGLRLSEATHVLVSDLDGARHRLLVSHAKGGHQRYTLLSDNLLAVLRQYYRQFRPQKFLFPGTQPLDPFMSDCTSGAKPELSVAKVLEVFLPDYLQTHALPVHHVKVLRRLAQCGSGKLGWTVWHCEHCQRHHWRPQGCGDRHCPACQHQRSADWLEKQQSVLLPVRYFHWVFTLPALLRPLALQNQKALYNLLFDCASATLLQFGRERFDAEIGITAILHTWGQNLMDHPHLHCLVTGGGRTAQNTWAGPKQTRWLFPHKAVADMFKGKFTAGLFELHSTGQLQFHGKLQALGDADAFADFLRQSRSRRWIVFAKGSVAGPECVLQYLGRYTHRVAISNGRLRAINPAAGTITFSYKDYADDSRIKLMTLGGPEFIRRLLLHVLPPSFTKIRHYGLLGNNRRKQQIPLARAALDHSPWRFQPLNIALQTSKPAPERFSCPFCQHSELRCIGRVDRSGKTTLFKLSAPITPTLAPLDSS